MGELAAALDDAMAGRGRLVMLVGEPGIGKTRTAEELAAYARQQGSLVLWGRCHEQQGTPPFWPWLQALQSYVREREPDQLRSEMGAGASVIADFRRYASSLKCSLCSKPGSSKSVTRKLAQDQTISTTSLCGFRNRRLSNGYKSYQTTPRGEDTL